MRNILNIHEYFDLCAEHDFGYSFSDDKFRYVNGINESNKLREYYNFSPHRHVYNAWKNYSLGSGEKPNYYTFI